jgi:hypothetical protein
MLLYLNTMCWSYYHQIFHKPTAKQVFRIRSLLGKVNTFIFKFILWTIWSEMIILLTIITLNICIIIPLILISTATSCSSSTTSSEVETLISYSISLLISGWSSSSFYSVEESSYLKWSSTRSSNILYS